MTTLLGQQEVVTKEEDFRPSAPVRLQVSSVLKGIIVKGDSPCPEKWVGVEKHGRQSMGLSPWQTE